MHVTVYGAPMRTCCVCLSRCADRNPPLSTPAIWASIHPWCSIPTNYLMEASNALEITPPKRVAGSVDVIYWNFARVAGLARSSGWVTIFNGILTQYLTLTQQSNLCEFTYGFSTKKWRFTLRVNTILSDKCSADSSSRNNKLSAVVRSHHMGKTNRGSSSARISVSQHPRLSGRIELAPSLLVLATNSFSKLQQQHYRIAGLFSGIKDVWSLERFKHRRLFILDPTLLVFQPSVVNWSIVHQFKTGNHIYKYKTMSIDSMTSLCHIEMVDRKSRAHLDYHINNAVMAWGAFLVGLSCLSVRIRKYKSSTPVSSLPPTFQFRGFKKLENHFIRPRHVETILRGISENNTINYLSKFRQLKKLKNCLHWRRALEPTWWWI